MQRSDPALAAAAFDRSDPFITARVRTHLKHGIEMHDYSRSRRLPATLEDRAKAWVGGRKVK